MREIAYLSVYMKGDKRYKRLFSKLKWTKHQLCKTLRYNFKTFALNKPDYYNTGKKNQIKNKLKKRDKIKMISLDKMINEYSTLTNLIAGEYIINSSSSSNIGSHNDGTNSIKTTNRTNVVYNKLMSHHSKKTVFMLLAVLLYTCAAATGDLSGKLIYRKYCISFETLSIQLKATLDQTNEKTAAIHFCQFW